MFLGIDIGTTKVAAVIADGDGRVRADASAAHAADLPTPSGRSEQDADRLLDAAWATVRRLPAADRRRVRAVGVTGQMHGAMLVDRDARPVTALVTWQDQRGVEDPAFLPALATATGHVLRTGFGCATLAWLTRHAALPPGAAGACAIHDLAAARLCGSSRPVTDATDAASWGLFDLAALDWDWRAVAAAGLRRELLPPVVPPGSRLGLLAEPAAAELGLCAGIPVAAAIGDNQASLLATLRNPDEELALTLGTGGQLSAILPAGSVPAFDAARTFDYRPYPGGRYAVVAAALCGGSAWAWLADATQAWLTDLGATPPERGALYDRLSELGLAARDELVVRPRFRGERFDPNRRGSIEGLTAENFSPGALARGLARGIVANLRDMLPAEALRGRRRVVGSGNALRRTPLLQRMTEEVLGLPLVIPDGREEAATGAALLAAATLTEAVA